MVELLLDQKANVDVENFGEMLQCSKRPFNIFTYPFDSFGLFLFYLYYSIHLAASHGNLLTVVLLLERCDSHPKILPMVNYG